MSVNIVNKDLSLNRLASNSNVTIGIREAVMGKIDVLFNGSISSSGTATLSKPYTNYDYIEIQVSNSKFYAFESKRYLLNMINNSSSSNKLRYYMTSSSNFTFYKTSSTQLYFTTSSLVINKIIGYKMGVMKATIDNPKNGDIYSTSATLTGGTWINGKPIYRKIVTESLTSTTSASFDISHGLGFDEIVNFRGVIISSNKRNYPLPYVDSSGNSTSVYVIPDYFKVVIKGQSWSSGTSLRFIIDYTM